MAFSVVYALVNEVDSSVLWFFSTAAGYVVQQLTVFFSDTEMFCEQKWMVEMAESTITRI